MGTKIRVRLPKKPERTDTRKLRKGDIVKIVKPFKGFGMYGMRKGSVGKVLRKTSFRGKEAYQVRFQKARKELTLFSTEIEKRKTKRKRR